MATRDDVANVESSIARVQEQVNSIETELKYGRYESRLGNLKQKVFGSPARSAIPIPGSGALCHSSTKKRLPNPEE